MNIDFLDLAEAELDDAFEYYEDIQKGLGCRFIVELKSTLSRVQHNPEAWQKFGQRTHRCLLNRFSYAVIYQIRVDLILIVAIACNHQEPNYWVNRVNN
jgi:plasmid stabilization system protein ParE